MKLVTIDYSFKHNDNMFWNEVENILFTVDAKTNEEAREKIEKYIKSKCTDYSTTRLDNMEFVEHIY